MEEIELEKIEDFEADPGLIPAINVIVSVLVPAAIVGIICFLVNDTFPKHETNLLAMLAIVVLVFGAAINALVTIWDTPKLVTSVHRSVAKLLPFLWLIGAAVGYSVSTDLIEEKKVITTDDFEICGTAYME